MADAKTEKQKVQEITEKLEQGIKELFESEKYKTYLNTMSKFHNYSFNNTMLIAMQKPDATLVAGFKAWQKNFDRHVKKGEKGIRILAPAPYKIKEEQEKLDPVTGEIMLDKNGMPITEEVEIKIPAFRVVPVFDVSQTDGKELPDIGVNELSGSVEDYEDFMQALTEVSPVPITYEDIEGEAKGYFHTTDHRIAIQEGMSQSQTVKTAIHEVAHAKLHDRERNQDIDAVLDKDRNTKEVEAESVAYTVCQHFGIDTSDYSFGYIAGWSSDRDMKELKSSLDTIRKTASELITGIEDRLAELQKDRLAEQEQNKESILLIQNDDLTQYSLVSVVGMDRQELMDVLYRGKDAQYSDDKARTTFGVSVHGIEFDVIHVRNNENVLSLDFTHSSEAKESKHFMDDLQTLSDSIGIDKVRVHRDMTPEEVKDFVKQRFEYQLKQGGLDDISLYMSRFDTLYEQGKMEKLMPTANQKHIEENVPITEWDNPYFEVKEPEQMAFSIKDKFVSIQTCTEGYDYSVFDADYRLIDGGVYDNPDISIYAALKDVLEDFGLSEQDKRIPVDYEELMEKTEAVEREQLNERIRAEVPEADSVVADFKAKTEELFNGINGQTQDDIEQTVWAYLQSKIDEYEIDVELVDVVVSGSRCRGLEKAGSDLDVVVEYKGREHEDTLFNAFNEDGLMIGGIKVDINPITEGKTGTLATYLPGVESYLAEKRAMQKASAVEATSEKTVTLTVAECGEFHSLGEFHENIASVEEAIAVWKSIPPERMNGIPSIGINIHTEGTEHYEDVEMDILSGKVIDLEVLDYVPDITDDPKAIEVIAELIDKLSDIEVRGSLEKWQAAILATEIDQFSYDYDTYQYRDTVEDREAQVANITEDIRNGNTGYLNDFLNAVISEGVREGITDIFGQGVEIDDSEAVQTARRAKELLDKLAEYKPLAKVEELTEQNYNMIDNVLNNGAEKKEQEQTKGRISIKEKLAEKKAVIEQRDKAERTSPEKETEKKSQREM
ncbi:ArdC-like ssDNA-binding domain-containing protein [bacterium]|nr:ArdC-like ssDNA-binding domain-containing protein [bacterium]